MYGDTTVIRRLAATLRAQAGDIRILADALVGRAQHARWTGLAADAMRARVADQATRLRRTALLHDDAAQALDRHAAEVDRVKDLIASIERRVHHLVDAARGRIASLAHAVLPDHLDDLLDRFVPPPHGSVAWLGVDLPGVGR